MDWQQVLAGLGSALSTAGRGLSARNAESAALAESKRRFDEQMAAQQQERLDRMNREMGQVNAAASMAVEQEVARKSEAGKRGATVEAILGATPSGAAIIDRIRSSGGDLSTIPAGDIDTLVRALAPPREPAQRNIDPLSPEGLTAQEKLIRLRERIQGGGGAGGSGGGPSSPDPESTGYARLQKAKDAFADRMLQITGGAVPYRFNETDTATAKRLGMQEGDYVAAKARLTAKGKGAGQPTEAERRGAALYQLAKPSADRLAQQIGDGATPSTLDVLAERGPDLLTNWMVSSEGQQYLNDLANVVMATQYAISGASANESEARRIARTLMPRPGDSGALKRQKQSDIANRLKIVRELGGRAIQDDEGTAVGPGEPATAVPDADALDPAVQRARARVAAKRKGAS